MEFLFNSAPLLLNIASSAKLAASVTEKVFKPDGNTESNS